MLKIVGLCLNDRVCLINAPCGPKIKMTAGVLCGVQRGYLGLPFIALAL